jgi:hypothetical protein
MVSNMPQNHNLISLAVCAQNNSVEQCTIWHADVIASDGVLLTAVSARNSLETGFSISWLSRGDLNVSISARSRDPTVSVSKKSFSMSLRQVFQCLDLGLVSKRRHKTFRVRSSAGSPLPEIFFEGSM